MTQLFLNLGTSRGCVVSITPRPPLSPVPIVQEAGWVPEPVWIGAENLAPQRFDPRTFQPAATTLSRLPQLVVLQRKKNLRALVLECYLR
jgi:hypothetical protein